jgi:hypothetical protein
MGCEACLYGTYDCPCCETGRYNVPSHCEDCHQEYNDCICEESWYKLAQEFILVGDFVEPSDLRAVKNCGEAIEKGLAKKRKKYPAGDYSWITILVQEDVMLRRLGGI